MGFAKKSSKLRRPRSDDPSWSVHQDDFPDDESDYQSSVYSLSNLVESWVGKSAVSTVILEDAVETTLQESDDEDSIPPPAPPVEEYYGGSESVQQKKGCRRYLLGGTLLALIAVVAVAVVAVIVPDRSSGNAEASSFAGEEDTTTTTTTNTDPPATREQAFRNLATEVSSSESLDTFGSPQERALSWLATYDSAQLDPSTANQREIQERYILGVFYFATGGANWFDRFDFLSQKHVCNWRNVDFGMGVSCDDSTKTVNGFKFGPNNLQGSLPEEIFLLEGLVSFQIIMNPGLTGPIPDSIGTLQNLEVLNLNKNSLGGEIPDTLLSLPSLTTLWMDENSFEGTIPVINYEDETMLQWWSCNSCGLTGRMPDELRYPNL